jgi:hypothetical protein
MCTRFPERIPVDVCRPARRPLTSVLRRTRAISGPGLIITRKVTETITRIWSSNFVPLVKLTGKSECLLGRHRACAWLRGPPLRICSKRLEKARLRSQLLSPLRSNPSNVRRSPSSSMTASASTGRDTLGSRRQMACMPAARAPATSTSGWSPTKTA